MQKGYKHTEATKEKMRENALSRDNTNRLKALPKGTKHWNWTNKPSLLTLHKRIHRKYGKASNFKCVDCSKTARDWSNKGTYTDRIEDYEPRCRKCHVRKDENWKKNKSENWKSLGRNKKGQFTTP